MEHIVKNFTTAQVAAMFNTSRRTVEGWRLRGQGPRYFKLSNGRRARVRYSEQALRDFVDQMTVQGVEGIGQ